MLYDLATSIEDAHVAATANTNIEAILAWANSFSERTAGNVGATVIATSNVMTANEPVEDKFVVFTVGDGTPADEAGWVPGNHRPRGLWRSRL